MNPVKMPVKIPCFTAEESESQPQLLSPHADLTCEKLRAAYRLYSYASLILLNIILCLFQISSNN